MKKTLPIKGMHCRSCELLIEESLKALPGVKNAEVSYKKKEATVYAKENIDDVVLRGAVEKAGYYVGSDDAKEWISSDPKIYRELFEAAAVVLVLYFVIIKTGLLNFNTGATTGTPSLFVVLLIGLTAGLSTCMALVGGLVLGISARHAEKHPEADAFQKFRPHVFFNIGRIASYIVLGGAIGSIGKVFQISGLYLGVLTIAVGLVMLFLGLQLIELFPFLSGGSFTFSSGISKFLGIKKHHDKEYSHTNSAVVGALTFFLPCGFTQAMQLLAMSSGSFLSGALIMGTFALGTAPGLLGVGGLTSVLKGAFAKKFFKFTGLVVILLSLFNISNGYNLTGWNAFAFLGQTSAGSGASNAQTDNGVQTVRMTQSDSGYSPDSFVVKKGVPVRWVIDAKSPRSCSSSIVMSSMNIRKSLQAGENVIEFTPTKVGNIRFTCSMGMYSGNFQVVDGETSSVTNKQLSTPPTGNPVTSVARSISAPLVAPATTQNAGNLQIIKAVFSSPTEDISPRDFTVTAGKPVQFDIEARADGKGCMSTIMIPGLINKSTLLEKGKTIRFLFTATTPGTYKITCAMGVPRGKIIVQ